MPYFMAFFEMENNTSMDNNIQLNNARSVVERLEAQKGEFVENFLTMVQGNTYSDVSVSESNIVNNAKFIVDLWD